MVLSINFELKHFFVKFYQRFYQRPEAEIGGVLQKKLFLNTLENSQENTCLGFSGDFIVNFEHISLLSLVLLYVTLNK